MPTSLGKRRSGPESKPEAGSRGCSPTVSDTGNSVQLNPDMPFPARICGIECNCLLDTGSTISIINKAIFDVLPNATVSMTATRARTAAQEQLPLLGRTVLAVQIGRVQKSVPFYVPDVIDVPCLFGVDFLQHVQPCVIGLQRKCLSFVPSEAVRSVRAEAVSVGTVVLGKDVFVPSGSETVVRGFFTTAITRALLWSSPRGISQGWRL